VPTSLILTLTTPPKVNKHILGTTQVFYVLRLVISKLLVMTETNVNFKVKDLKRFVGKYPSEIFKLLI